MTTKKISVNPDFFKMGKSKTLRKERKKRSARNSDYSENKELKMKLINKIKEHKRKEKENKEGRVISPDDSRQNDLNNSLDYLQSLSAKHKSKKEKRRERKMARRLERQRIQQHQMGPIMIQHPQQTTQPPSLYTTPSSMAGHPRIQLNTPIQQLNQSMLSGGMNPTSYIVNDESIINMKPDPPYGILKHGKKPLFSIYNKTLKKPRSIGQPTTSPITILHTPNKDGTNVNIHTDQFFERQKNLNQLKDQLSVSGLSNIPFSVPAKSSSMLKPGKTLKRMKQLHTTTKRFIHLGKKDGRVGVLIKNQKTRKKILKDTNTLKKRPLTKIKNYLRKHNLIKIGSTAPEHIIRSIYENSFLAGDVYNKNVDMLLHNYLDS